MRLDDLTYDAFVKELLLSLSPLFPGKLSLATFSGGEGDGRDSATLYCERAEFFSKLGQDTAKELGVDKTRYVCGKTRISEEPILRHAAYAKNIRRWVNGDRPRKRVARADLILVSVCWLYGWGDTDLLGDSAHDEARERLHERLCIDVFCDTEPKDVVSALKEISETTYQNTLRTRRTL